MQAGPGDKQLSSPKDFELGLPRAVEDSSDVGGDLGQRLGHLPSGEPPPLPKGREMGS